MKVRCIHKQEIAWLSLGDVYEAEPCLCNSAPRSCPEHGVRCRNPDCDKLCDRVDSMSSLDANGKTLHWCSEACWRERHFAEQPKCPKCSSDNISHDADNVEHCMGCGWPTDKALAELPKVDKYEEHRLNSVSELTLRELTDEKQPGATARLLRGLEGEKVRERVRGFPKQGRNFELKGKR